MESGAKLSDAAALELRWTAPTDGDGPVRYAAGFHSSHTQSAAELTAYDAAGTHTMPVADDQRWYAIVHAFDFVLSLGISPSS